LLAQVKMLFTEMQIYLDLNNEEIITLPSYTIYQYRPEIMALREKNIVYHDQIDDYIKFNILINTKKKFISDFEFVDRF